MAGRGGLAGGWRGGGGRLLRAVHYLAACSSSGSGGGRGACSAGLSNRCLPEDGARQLSGLGVLLEGGTLGVHGGQVVQAALHVVEQEGGVPGEDRHHHRGCRGGHGGGSVPRDDLLLLLLRPAPPVVAGGGGGGDALALEAGGGVLHQETRGTEGGRAGLSGRQRSTSYDRWCRHCAVAAGVHTSPMYSCCLPDGSRCMGGGSGLPREPPGQCNTGSRRVA